MVRLFPEQLLTMNCMDMILSKLLGVIEILFVLCLCSVIVYFVFVLLTGCLVTLCDYLRDKKMKLKEKNDILKWAAYKSDKELEAAYFEGLKDVLGSQAEIMEERGYDEVDIRERRKFEKYMDEKSDLLAEICERRGIKLWGDDEK